MIYVICLDLVCFGGVMAVCFLLSQYWGLSPQEKADNYEDSYIKPEDISILTDIKLRHRNISKIKVQGIMTPSKVRNYSVTESKDIEMDKMTRNSKV
jgi:hypothetical protein